MTRTQFLTLAGVAAAVLLHAGDTSAQIVTGRGVNPLTGRVVGGTAIHNPFTGQSRVTAGAYNPYTGAGTRIGGMNNPWTGNTARGFQTTNTFSLVPCGGRTLG